MAIVYISHHLDEVLAIADQITVFRDGRQVDAVDALAIDKAGLIAKMVGHSVDAAAPRAKSRARGNPLLSVAGLSVPGRLIDVSLAVDRREIVGLTGLTGAGARNSRLGHGRRRRGRWRDDTSRRALCARFR